jgi:hypothetical protein
VTAGPGDYLAAVAVGRGHLRASHADREQVIDTLKAAFVQGRLGKDEFDARIGQTFTSRTYAELAEVTAGIPAGLTGAQPLREPAQPLREPAQPPREPAGARAKKAAAWGAYGILMPTLFAAVIVPGYTTVVVAITTTAVIYFFFWLIGAFIMIANSEW